MNQWLKLSQCKYTPSETFTIFDYTKIAYPIDSGFYIKQVVIDQQKPTFIEIKHQFDKIISMYSTVNYIITLERKQRQYYVCFYGVGIDELRYRVEISFEEGRVGTGEGKGEETAILSFFKDNILIICATSHDQVQNQILFFDCQTRKIIGQGFVQGKIQHAAMGLNNSLSIYMGKHVTAYKNQPVGPDHIGKIYKQLQITLNSALQVQKHFWVEDELIVWGVNKIHVIIKNKVCQQFNNFHRLHYVMPLICGFLVADGCVAKVYKKKGLEYEFVCELIDQFLMQCKNVCLSPQQDILAYFTPSSNSIIVSTKFSQQVQQNRNRQPTQITQTLKIKQISHSKAYDYTLYSSPQSWFAAVNGTQIQLINSHNYQQFLTVELNNQSGSFMDNSQTKIRYLVIHPNRPIFVVALKKCIRIYYVTFNQVRLIKELNVSLCSYLLINHCGSILTVVVSGKGGAKLYNYKLNEFKLDFSLLETLTIGKKPISLEWDSLDTKLYCFFNEGYYVWPLQSKLRNKKQTIIDFQSQIIQGACLSIENDNKIFWSSKKIFQIQQTTQPEVSVKIKDIQISQVKIKNIMKQNENYIIVLENGKVGRSKILQLDACNSSKSFDLNNKNKRFELLLQQQNKLIYISQDLNIKFLQFGFPNSIFSNIVGIQKKRLYKIMNKHNHYENQIKKIKQDYNAIIYEIKSSALAQQKKIQSQYKVQLHDHINRQKKVKQQKVKLQQMMQKNLQIKEKQTMHQVKQLQRLYQRKIALTTNKLLTQKQIGFRDKVTAENRLKVLEEKHYLNIEQIRKQFSDYIRSNMFDKDQAQKEVNSMKKEYETRLYQLEEENQILLKGLQEKNQNAIISLKKMVNLWQNKYNQCNSQKDNLKQQCRQQQINCQILKQKISFIQTRKLQAQRRCDNLSAEINKIERVLEQRNQVLQFYEKRIDDLEKSNQILKYRVLEVKEQNDPYQDEIGKLKSNLNDLEEEYERLLKQSHQMEQKMEVLKKEKNKFKQDNQFSLQKYKKLSKRHQQFIDKIRQITKSPIQQIRRQLLAILQNYVKLQKSYSVLQKRNDSPLGELNRIRDHLEVCLDEAVTTNKKNQEQRKIQITKKNMENSQLIKQINDLRKKLRIFQDQISKKNLQISRLIRGQTPTITVKQQKNSTTEAQSKQFTKTRSRQTFYQKSMFRSGNHWNSKRLKTQQGGSRRKKSSHSMMRDRTHNASLAIHPQAQQVEEYRRIIQQKDIFIQKLIAKIQKS